MWVQWLIGFTLDDINTCKVGVSFHSFIRVLTGFARWDTIFGEVFLSKNHLWRLQNQRAFNFRFLTHITGKLFAPRYHRWEWWQSGGLLLQDRRSLDNVQSISGWLLWLSIIVQYAPFLSIIFEGRFARCLIIGFNAYDWLRDLSAHNLAIGSNVAFAILSSFILTHEQSLFSSSQVYSFMLSYYWWVTIVMKCLWLTWTKG